MRIYFLLILLFFSISSTKALCEASPRSLAVALALNEQDPTPTQLPTQKLISATSTPSAETESIPKALSSKADTVLIPKVPPVAKNASSTDLVLPEADSITPVNSIPQTQVKPIFLDVLELKDMDINDVFKLIANKSGLNIIAGKNVAGRVTIFLQNVEVHDALHIILEANDLAYVENGGIVQIMQAADFERSYGYKFGRSSEREVFEINYAKAEDIVKAITPALTKDLGHVEFDAHSNKVIVSDIAPKISEVRKLINALDRQEKQVLIEAKIIQVDLTGAFAMGIDWNTFAQSWHKLNFSSNSSYLLSGANFNANSKLQIGSLDARHYGAVLQALDNSGKSHVLSNPRIAAMNNQEAKILVGSSQPYVTSTTTSAASGLNTSSEAVTFLDIGVKLSVTPTIHKDGYITMKIKPEVSSSSNVVHTSSGNDIPVVDTSTVETTVKVKDGVTIIIGGLIKEQRNDNHNSLPFLSRIPFVGAAIANNKRSSSKEEIVVFLTPHIISGDVQVDSNIPTSIKSDKLY